MDDVIRTNPYIFHQTCLSLELRTLNPKRWTTENLFPWVTGWKYVKNRSLTWNITLQVGTLEGERQRTVKEWSTFMGQPTEYADNILLQAIPLHLKNPVQVFSYDSKHDTVYMQTIPCVILSGGDHGNLFGPSPTSSV